MANMGGAQGPMPGQGIMGGQGMMPGQGMMGGGMGMGMPGYSAMGMPGPMQSGMTGQGMMGGGGMMPGMGVMGGGSVGMGGMGNGMPYGVGAFGMGEGREGQAGPVYVSICDAVTALTMVTGNAPVHLWWLLGRGLWQSGNRSDGAPAISWWARKGLVWLRSAQILEQSVGREEPVLSGFQKTKKRTSRMHLLYASQRTS